MKFISYFFTLQTTSQSLLEKGSGNLLRVHSPLSTSILTNLPFLRLSNLTVPQSYQKSVVEPELRTLVQKSDWLYHSSLCDLRQAT